MKNLCSRPFAILTASILLAAPTSVTAATYTWFPTGGTTDWNLSFNWDPSTAFPNAPGDVANLTSNLISNQTINLQQDITLGTLNLGDADGSHLFTIAGGGVNSLIF